MGGKSLFLQLNLILEKFSKVKSYINKFTYKILNTKINKKF